MNGSIYECKKCGEPTGNESEICDTCLITEEIEAEGRKIHERDDFYRRQLEQDYR